MKRHLVVSGTGPVGSLVVDILLDKALLVRATTAERWRQGDRGPVSWAYLDLESGEGIEQAFAGVDRALIAVPPELENASECVLPLVAEAKRRRLEKVVMLTPMGVDGAPLRRCELELERSGLRHDILRLDRQVNPRDVAATAAMLLIRDDLDARIIAA
jgi:uncharacterized protein YbjT (DUF2867 family)